MIRIKKKATDRPIVPYEIGPNKGRCKLVVSKEEIIDQYNSDSAAFHANTKSLTIKNIYGDSAIRDKLMSIQHGKCCYCEKRLDSEEVEHFRPKSSYRQFAGHERKHPGYYWLAYDWENLILVCHSCNQVKNDVFPVHSQSNRATDHLGDIAGETPLIIDPSSQRPNRYLYFQGALVFPKNNPLVKHNRVIGNTTIKVLELNRRNLETIRGDHLQTIQNLVKVVLDDDSGEQTREMAKSRLVYYCRPVAPFSAMTKDYLKSIGYFDRIETTG